MLDYAHVLSTYSFAGSSASDPAGLGVPEGNAIASVGILCKRSGLKLVSGHREWRCARDSRVGYLEPKWNADDGRIREEAC